MAIRGDRIAEREGADAERMGAGVEAVRTVAIPEGGGVESEGKSPFTVSPWSPLSPGEGGWEGTGERGLGE
jgi:hypothetical protein